ncbi:large ribosomal subunit protein uL23m isoform X2 [Channa argus]|uniref:large ribosomal subunit protein uL23m isoform X2 n=1 Tax=Channa argus TaxID=215402 RepID=UPI00351FEE72
MTALKKKILLKHWCKWTAGTDAYNHLGMTKYDVKNYLEKIYNVPVGAVRTRIQFGSNKKRNHLNQKVKQPDYKVAYVQLAQGQTFTFPDIFPQKDRVPAEGSMEEMQEKFMEDEKQRQKLDPRRGGVTEWFGL